MSIISMPDAMTRTTSRQAASRRKDVTHERIVAAAARAIRRSGYAGTSVADIMKEAGLTHGGFYAHFASREAMLAEAADRAGAEGVAARRTPGAWRGISEPSAATAQPVSTASTCALER